MSGPYRPEEKPWEPCPHSTRPWEHTYPRTPDTPIDPEDLAHRLKLVEKHWERTKDLPVMNLEHVARDWWRIHLTLGAIALFLWGAGGLLCDYLARWYLGYL